MWKSGPIRRNAVGPFFSSLHLDFDERDGIMIFIAAELYRNTSMNPQPSADVAQACATIAFLIGAFYAFIAYNNVMSGSMPAPNYDSFTLGTIEASPSQVVVIEKQKTNTFESQQLYIDCIDTLVAIGYKKSEAKKRAKAIFSKHNPTPTSVQEFLNIVMKK